MDVVTQSFHHSSPSPLVLAPYYHPENTATSYPIPQLMGFWTCYFIDLPSAQALDKIPSPEADSRELFECFLRAKSLSTDNVSSCTVHLVLVVLINILGLIGVVANVGNILVLPKTSTACEKYSFRKLLRILAFLDMMACFCAILTATLLQVILSNIDRSRWTLVSFKLFFLLYSFGRTSSNFLTILLAMERYFVIVHYFRAKTWLNSKRRRAILLTGFVFAVAINLPWWLNSVVVTLDVSPESQGPLSKAPSIFLTTYFGSKIYYSVWVRPVHVFIDFVLPIPLLLLFNGLLYRFIYQWRRDRHTLTGNSVQRIHTAKMFSVMTLILFFCHSVGLIDFIITEATDVVYRELLLFNILVVTVNGTLNFFVYYAFGRDFRESFWLLLCSSRKQGQQRRQKDRNNYNAGMAPPFFDRAMHTLSSGNIQKTDGENANLKKHNTEV